MSLRDATVKVFYEDSLKFFLSLYGHRLPALCHDVSSDSQRRYHIECIHSAPEAMKQVRRPHSLCEFVC